MAVAKRSPPKSRKLMTSLESRIMEVDVGKVLDGPTTEQRGLGLSACTALVVGNMIGSGIFLLLASLAGYLPDIQSLTSEKLVSKEMVATTRESQPLANPLRPTHSSSERSVPQ